MTTAFAIQEGQKCFLRLMNRRYLVTVRAVSEDTVWVTFRAEGYPVQGLGADLEVYDGDMLNVYHLRVALSPRDDDAGMVLERAVGVNYTRQRQSWRVPMNLTVRVKQEDMDRFSSARLCNLSAEGALIETTAPLILGAHVFVEMQLPDEKKYAYEARIVRVAGTSRERRTESFGLRFVELNGPRHSSLTRFLWQAIRKKRNTELRELFPGACRQ